MGIFILEDHTIKAKKIGIIGLRNIPLRIHNKNIISGPGQPDIRGLLEMNTDVRGLRRFQRITLGNLYGRQDLRESLFKNSSVLLQTIGVAAIIEDHYIKHLIKTTIRVFRQDVCPKPWLCGLERSFGLDGNHERTAMETACGDGKYAF
jgi:hypothetical protein